DRLAERECGREAVLGGGKVALVQEGRAETVERRRLADLLADRPADRERLFLALAGAGEIALPAQDRAQVVERRGFARLVALLAAQGERALEQLASLGEIAARREPRRQVRERGGLAAPVSGLAREGEGLLVEPDRRRRLPLAPQDDRQVVESSRLGSLVADRAVGAERLLEEAARAGQVAAVEQEVRGLGDRVGHAGLVARPFVEGARRGARGLAGRGLTEVAQGPALREAGGSGQQVRAQTIGARGSGRRGLPLAREVGESLGRRGLREVDPRVLAARLRQPAERREGLLRLLRPAPGGLGGREAQAMVEIVREGAEERTVDLDRPRPVLGGLGEAPLDRQALLFGQAARQLERFLRFRAGLRVVTEARPGGG